MQESEPVFPPDDGWREPRLVMDPGCGVRIRVFVWVSPTHTTRLMYDHHDLRARHCLRTLVGSPVWSAVIIHLILGTEPH